MNARGICFKIGDFVSTIPGYVATSVNGVGRGFETTGQEIGEVVAFTGRWLRVRFSNGGEYLFEPQLVRYVDRLRSEPGELDPKEEIERCLEALR